MGNETVKKYELTDNSIEFCGKTLHQIKRLSDGELGGYIESEYNLSQEEECWVGGDAKVCDQATVSGNAQISGQAVMYGKAQVYGEVQVFDTAVVSGQATVRGNVKIYGEAHVHGNSCVFEDVEVFEMAVVTGDAVVCGKVKVHDVAYIHGNAYLTENAIATKHVISLDLPWGNITIVDNYIMMHQWAIPIGQFLENFDDLVEGWLLIPVQRDLYKKVIFTVLGREDLI